jgi:curved DNA-binding protein CbpA
MSLGNARIACRRGCRRDFSLSLHFTDGIAAGSVQTVQHLHCQRRQFTLSARIHLHRTLEHPLLLLEASCKRTRRSFTTSPPVNDPETSSSTSASSSPPFESPHRPHIPWPKHANPTPYEIFNLPRTASPKEVKSRYFLLVKQYHPDHAAHSPSDARAATERFRKVVEAYKILSHPSKRQEYDNQHPFTPTHAGGYQQRHSEFRRPWSGSRLSRQKTEPKGPPPSGVHEAGGAYAFGRKPPGSRYDADHGSQNSDADNAHFNYKAHYRRNLEQEMRIKKRMDELHRNRIEFENEQREQKKTMRFGLIFTGGLFACVLLAARAMANAV